MEQKGKEICETAQFTDYHNLRREAIQSAKSDRKRREREIADPMKIAATVGDIERLSDSRAVIRLFFECPMTRQVV